MSLRAQFGALHKALKRLLISDIFIRTCEGMVSVFVVLYATDVIGITSLQFGLLVGVQMASSIAAYLPAAKLADRYGRKPFVVATFICFSLFPLAVVLSHSFAALIPAFVIGGLRELGEPARKATLAFSRRVNGHERECENCAARARLERLVRHRMAQFVLLIRIKDCAGEDA
ncbi:MAG: hypothetical protein V7641_4263 [Blastocatellia bacterium]